MSFHFPDGCVVSTLARHSAEGPLRSRTERLIGKGDGDPPG
jgi:hypothetical protein